MKVLFITTSNLATNPRLVKEIELASSIGFDIELIQFNLKNWSDKLTKQILTSYPKIIQIEIPAGRKPFFAWFFSSVLEKIFSYIPSFLLPTKWLSISLNKRSYLINRHLNRISSKPDIIIAHNPGSFFSAMVLANKLNTEFAIDVEDYHPGETPSTWQSNRLKKLIIKTLPKAKYVSFASMLIMEQIESDLQEAKLSIKRSILVDNVFPKSEFAEIKPLSLDLSKLNFVWFSQNIDYFRGLEFIFTILDEFQNEVSLTLIGNIRNEFYQNEILHRSYIDLEEPKAQKDLHSILHNFDIGLALEMRATDMNRDICLTNKIWAYLQSGLFILSSSTKAQEQFIDQYKFHGEIIFDIEKCKLQIQSLIRNKEQIRQKRGCRMRINNSVNWDVESQKLKSVWKIK